MPWISLENIRMGVDTKVCVSEYYILPEIKLLNSLNTINVSSAQFETDVPVQAVDVLQLFCVEMTGKHWSTYAQSFGSILLNPDLKDLYKGLKYSTFNLNFKFKESSDQVHADINQLNLCSFSSFFFFVMTL